MFDHMQEMVGIPQGLDAMPPGPRLAALLSSIAVEQLEGRDAVLFARAQQRQISHDQARQYRALARVADLYIEESTDFDLYEFAAASNTGRLGSTGSWLMAPSSGPANSDSSTSPIRLR